MAAIDSVLAVLADAETGQRGFLLTDEDRCGEWTE
jgi:CHASE3 domain sensor protein